MRKIALSFALIAALMSPAKANFTGKNASAATVTFANPGDCTSVVCTPIFAQYDSTGTNAVAVLTVGADGASNTATGALGYMRNMVFNGTTWDRWTGAVTVSGGATSALQTTGNASLSTIATNTGTIATNSGTQATAALQTTGNTALAAIQASSATTATNSALPLPAQSNFTTNIGNVAITDANANVALVDPCQSGAKTYTPINIITAANTKIVAGTASKKTYICGLFLYPGAADNIAIIEGSGTNCGTSPLGLIGGNTAATGIIATAQAGFVLPTTGYAHAASTVNANDFCLITSAGVQLSGVAVTTVR